MPKPLTAAITPEQQERYEAARLERDRQYRRARRAWLKAVRARRTLACALIADGYRQQARKAHPDVGGSSDGMHQLTTVRDALVAAVARLDEAALMGTRAPLW